MRLPCASASRKERLCGCRAPFPGRFCRCLRAGAEKVRACSHFDVVCQKLTHVLAMCKCLAQRETLRMPSSFLRSLLPLLAHRRGKGSCMQSLRCCLPKAYACACHVQVPRAKRDSADAELLSPVASAVACAQARRRFVHAVTSMLSAKSLRMCLPCASASRKERLCGCRAPFPGRFCRCLRTGAEKVRACSHFDVVCQKLTHVLAMCVPRAKRDSADAELLSPVASAVACAQARALSKSLRFPRVALLPLLAHRRGKGSCMQSLRCCLPKAYACACHVQVPRAKRDSADAELLSPVASAVACAQARKRFVHAVTFDVVCQKLTHVLAMCKCLAQRETLRMPSSFPRSLLPLLAHRHAVTSMLSAKSLRM